MELFAEALATIADIMQHGAASHPDNDGVRRSPVYHVGRSVEHLQALQDGDQRQDSYRACRARVLMALTLREIG